MRVTIPVLVFAAVLLLAGCQSVPSEIPDDLTLPELIQSAQESVDAENWNAALAYYDAILERFPEDRTAVATARYEIGFIHYRRGDNDLARDVFASLLVMYETESATIPAWPRVLARTLLDMMDDSEATRSGQ